MSDIREIGNTFFKEKNYNEAIKSYSDAINLNENDKFSYSNRSVSYLNIGEYKNALNDAMKIIKIDSKWAKGWNRLGNALEKLDDFENAKESYRKAIELESNNLSYKNNLDRINKLEKNKNSSQNDNMLNNMGENDLLNNMFKNVMNGNTDGDQNNLLNDMFKNTMNSEMGSNLFNNMLNNKNLQEKFKDPNFLKKMSENKNPASLMQDPEIMNLASGLFNSMGSNFPKNSNVKSKSKKNKKKEYIIDTKDDNSKEDEINNIENIIKDLDNINLSGNKEKIIDDDNSTEESI